MDTGKVVREAVRLKKESFRDMLSRGTPEAVLEQARRAAATAVAPGIDEILPEMLKALGVEGLSWSTRLFNITWGSGSVPKEWQTGVVVSLFKMGDQRVCTYYRGITLLSLPGKVYSKVLERRVQWTAEPQIEEEQCGFCTGRGTMDQLFTLAGILEGAWEYNLLVHMCIVDLEKAYDHVPWDVL